MSSLPQNDFTIETYEIEGCLKGRALIFNQYEFNPCLKVENRRGTDLDEDSLKRTFLKIGIQPDNISIYRDRTEKEIFDILEKVAKEDHTSHNIFMCAIMTHGETGYVYAKDKMFETYLLWKCFVDDNCPSLKGKPKIFLIQACRGRRLDEGVKVKFEKKTQAQEEVDSSTKNLVVSLSESDKKFDLNFNETGNQKSAADNFQHLSCESDSKTSRKKSHSEVGDASPVDDIDIVCSNINTDPDMVVIYSTSDGFYSFRRPTSGSWYIQAFCKVLENDYKNFDFISILTRINRNVAIDCISNVSGTKLKEFDKKKQMPCFATTLTKLLYLHPQTSPL